MTNSVAAVEVVPATVTPVFRCVRETARVCNEAGWRLSTHTPVMPPRFLLAWRPALDVATIGLRLLALDLEMTCLDGWSRLAQIEAAGGGELNPLGPDVVADMANAAGYAWGEVESERGFDQVVDPLGQRVHLTMGAADCVTSSWHTAATLMMAPLYGVSKPAGREARQELVAMLINLTRLAPAWVVLEPEDAGSAYTETLGRILDWPDLQRGDLFRWAGHLGAGLALGRGAAALAEGVGSLEGAGALEGVAGGTYQGVSQANKVPVSRARPPRTATGRKIRRAEEEVGKFLETAIP